MKIDFSLQKVTGRSSQKTLVFWHVAAQKLFGDWTITVMQLPFFRGVIGKRGAENVMYVDATIIGIRAKRAILFTGLGLVSLALASCGSSSAINLGNFGFGSGEQQEAKAKPTSVSFAPLIGAPANVSSELTSSLTSEFQKKQIAVVKDGATAQTGQITATAQTNQANAKATAQKVSAQISPDYTIRGYFVASAESKGTKLSYIWDIRDKENKATHRIKGEEFVAGKKSTDPWSIVKKDTLDKIAQKTATDLAAWLPSQKKRPATASVGNNKPQQTSANSAQKPVQTASIKPVATAPKTNKPLKPAKPVLMAAVPSVKGAPGDGNKTLSAALRKQLAARGVQLASTASTQGAYKVVGTVKMGKPASGNQSILIEWQVVDPSGKKLGTVSQKNSIPQGSLDGAWGDTANKAASAASKGIVELLPKKQG